MRMHWRRLIWILFIYAYSGLFFYNLLSPFSNWRIPYVYTMLLIVWLGLEYYERRLFFQTGFAPLVMYDWPLRAAFALFFYSSFVIGISTTVWWHSIQIPFYPIIHGIGFVVLVASIVLRRQTIRMKHVTTKSISQFYLSVLLLSASLALGYGSLFLVFYVLAIGCPLLFLLRRHEHRLLATIEAFAQTHKQKSNEELWQLYIEKKIKKQKKKRK